MSQTSTVSFCNRRGALATMHAKEQVIGPLLRRFLGVDVTLPTDFDTDRFGTFSREIARVGSQRDAARAKIDAVLKQDSEADFGLASEGSFGPHPEIPFLSLGRELVLLRDRATGLEISGYYSQLARSCQHRQVSDLAMALDFAEQVGFPRQGLIVMAMVDDEPAPELFLDKTIETWEGYREAVADTLARFGIAQIETDLRAHRNPARMRAIARATVDLVRNCLSQCPVCGQPGYQITGSVPGLPCADCGAPTRERKAMIRSCSGCGGSTQEPCAGTTADPGRCDLCNP